VDIVIGRISQRFLQNKDRLMLFTERLISSASCSRGATTSTTPTLIASPGLAMQVGALADAVIVGSGCVKTIGGSETSIETPKQFAADFRNSLR
jgi:hypothetical protein